MSLKDENNEVEIAVSKEEADGGKVNKKRKNDV